MSISAISADRFWNGGFIEAGIILGRNSDNDADVRLRSAIRALWAQSSISEPYAGRCIPECERPIKAFKEYDLDELQYLYGQIDYPQFGKLPFTSVVVRETGDEESPAGDDWLYACIPVGGLAEHIPQVGGWPFGDHEGSRAWLEPLEKGLASLVLAICEKINVSIACIGFEVAGVIDLHSKELIPNNTRFRGYIVNDADAYQYLPTTEWR